jgi:hypothetical protein
MAQRSVVIHGFVPLLPNSLPVGISGVSALVLVSSAVSSFCVFSRELGAKAGSIVGQEH